jgi:asparagine synthase (glutamine-hydrolysing)
MFPWITYIFDEPVSTGAAFFKAARVAKQSCTVMLCGQGSDEIFGGYSRYIHAHRQVRLNRMLSTILPSGVRDSLSEALPKLGNSKFFRKVCARLSLDPAEVAATYSGGMTKDDFSRFISGDSARLYRDQLREYSVSFPRRNDFLNNMLEMEMGNGLLEILQQTDRMTMAAAVETRVPFLDHELVEFAFSLPPRLKVCNGVGKYLMEKYLMRYFPAHFVMRPKMGFPTPIYQWFMNPANPIHGLIEEGFSSEIANRFNQPYVREFIARAKQGSFGHTTDVLDPLMRFLSFTVWWKTVQQPAWALSHRPKDADQDGLKAAPVRTPPVNRTAQSIEGPEPDASSRLLKGTYEQTRAR